MRDTSRMTIHVLINEHLFLCAGIVLKRRDKKPTAQVMLASFFHGAHRALWAIGTHSTERKPAQVSCHMTVMLC